MCVNLSLRRAVLRCRSTSAVARHRRGCGAHEAPLKENLASALLLRVAAPAHRRRRLLDPMWAALLIEGALMAADVA